MCAATCVIGEIKTRLLLAERQDAEASSKQAQDATRQPLENSSVHESANGATSKFDMLYEASFPEKKIKTSAPVAEKSNPRQRESASTALRHLIRRLPAMEATIIDNVLQAEEMCQEKKGLRRLSNDFRKLDGWEHWIPAEAKSAKDPYLKAKYIARLLWRTRDLCSADIKFVFYVFSYLELE